MRRLLVLIGCAALLLTGCGTADVHFHTTLRDRGEINQEITVTATGALAASLSDSMEISAREDGWDVEITEQHQATVLRAHKSFKQGEGFVANAEGALMEQPLSIATTNSFLFERNTLRVALPRRQIAAALAGSDTAFAGQPPEVVASTLAKTVRLTWTVTMPGEIESSNADSVSRDSATWVLALDEVQVDDELYVTSRSLKPGAVLTLVGTLVLLALIVLMYITLARRPHHDDRGLIRI